MVFLKLSNIHDEERLLTQDVWFEYFSNFPMNTDTRLYNFVKFASRYKNARMNFPIQEGIVYFCILNYPYAFQAMVLVLNVDIRTKVQPVTRLFLYSCLMPFTQVMNALNEGCKTEWMNVSEHIDVRNPHALCLITRALRLGIYYSPAISSSVHFMRSRKVLVGKLIIVRT